MLETREEVKALLAAENRRLMNLHGRKMNFYYPGTLAKVLGLTYWTFREMVEKGVIPQTPFTRPSSNKRGTRRLYTEDQIWRVWEIYRKYRTKEPFIPLQETEFADDVRICYENLTRAYKGA